jgi:hypothetical protein
MILFFTLDLVLTFAESPLSITWYRKTGVKKRKCQMAFVFVWLVIMAGKFSLAIYDHSISAFYSFIIKQKETLLLIALQGKVWIRSETI